MRDTTDEAIHGLIPPARIVQTVLTRPTGENGISAVDQKPLDPKHLGNLIAGEEGQMAKVKELKRYVLLQCIALLVLRKVSPGFDSLSIGGRFDVGLSEISPNARQFILEFTRWYGASTFGQNDSIEVSSAFASAFVHDVVQWTINGALE